jgi:hypothetical protein
MSEKIKNGELILIESKYSYWRIASNLNVVFGCLYPDKKHNHTECLLDKKENFINFGSIGIIIDSLLCNPALLNNLNQDKKLKLDIWYKCFIYDCIEKNHKIIWLRKKDFKIIGY